MNIKLKMNVVLPILIIGAVYFLYASVQKHFTPDYETSEDVNISTYSPMHISRKLLARHSNVNEVSLELEPDLNSFKKEKINGGGKLKEVSKKLISYNKLRRNQIKKLSRRKRNAHYNNFDWKLSLNVTNGQKHPKGVSNLSEDDLSSKFNKGKFLNMAVQMEGASPDDSFKELHHSWDSIGKFLRTLYRKNISFRENADDFTTEIISEPKDSVPSAIPAGRPERERTPKLIFGFFNTRTSENPIQGAGTTQGNGDSSESVTSPKINGTPKEGQSSTIVPLSSDTTDAPMEAFDSVETTVAPITEALMGFESTSSEVNTHLAEKFGETPDKDNPIEIASIKPEQSFTSEQLKEFCISLLSRIHVSPKSADHFADEDGSGEMNMLNMGDMDTMTGSSSLSTEVPKEVTTKTTNPRFGILASIWNRFAGRSMVSHPPEVSLQSSTLTAEHDIASEKAREITNGTPSLNGESGTNLTISDSTESDFFSEEDESALTVPDCEHFFRQMQNDAVFSKPNLLDIINNPILLSLDPTQFNFTEIRDEKQMRSMRSGSDSTDSNSESNPFLTEGIVNILNTPFSNDKSTDNELPGGISVNDFVSEQPDKSLLDIAVSNQEALSTPSFIDAQKSLQNEEFDKTDVDNAIVESKKDLATEIAFLSDKLTTMKIQSSTGIIDEGLLIQSDVHARTDKTSEVSTDIDERIFEMLNFGSGERSSEIRPTSEIPSSEVNTNIDERIFGLFNFGSSVSSSVVPSTSMIPSSTVIPSTTNIDERIFGLFNLESSISSSVIPLTSEMLPSEVSTDKDHRIFGMLNFGSGERSLEDLDSLNTESVTEFPENINFHPDLINFSSGDSELNEAFSKDLETTSSDSATGSNIFDVILSLHKEESQKSITESDAFDINEDNRPTEGGSTIFSVENPRIELQFDLEGKPAENQNTLDMTNMPPTQPISTDQNVFDEKPQIEFQLNLEEKFTESENVVFDSTHLPETQSLSKDTTPFQNVLDDITEESRILPGLLNVFGSGDGRELPRISTDSDNSEFSECLDCFKNKSSSFSVDDCIDCDDINDTAPLIGEHILTTINPLSNKIVSDASIDEIYVDNKAITFSESYFDPLELSTVHSPKRLSSSPVTLPISYEHTDNPENVVYEGYENHYNTENIVYEGYENHYNTGNIGYEGYENHYNTENIVYEGYENHDNSENLGYDVYEHHDSYDNINYEVTSFEPLEHVHVEGECNESHSDVNIEAFSASPTEATTVFKDGRFIDTLFLTGSGAGGLFGNDNGEINLVQEPDTTSFPFQNIPVSPRQSRRGGRMDDVPFPPTWPTEQKEHVSENQFDAIRPQIPSDNPQLNSYGVSEDTKVQTRRGRKEFNTDTTPILTTLRSTQSVEDVFNNPEYTRQPLQELSSSTITTINNPENSIKIPKKKVKELPPRYCNHAGECNVELNEGCITKEGHGICDCRRSFVRDPETDICEAPYMLKTSLRLPGEVFHQDLRDKYSEQYRNKTRDAIDTMWLVVYQDPTLEENIAAVNVAGFEEGSLVVHWELIFAVKKNESISEVVQEVDEKLKETFKRRDVLRSAPLNLENAKLLSVSRDINPCESKELNYCSNQADCIQDEQRGFRCRCKEGYLDNSKHPMYPGEICIATCPPDYCGENGYCEVRWNGQKQCLCNGWYFGEKCNVSGIFLISCFAGANGVLIVAVLAIVCFCKRRRQRTTRFYEHNQVMFQPNQDSRPFGRVSPRLAASIALDELGPTKNTKYMAISTPLYAVPNIQITSPSIIGSSISYDYDSTFDRTPSAEVIMEPPKYDSVPEVPKYDSVPDV